MPKKVNVYLKEFTLKKNMEAFWDRNNEVIFDADSIKQEFTKIKKDRKVYLQTPVLLKTLEQDHPEFELKIYEKDDKNTWKKVFTVLAGIALPSSLVNPVAGAAITLGLGVAVKVIDNIDSLNDDIHEGSVNISDVNWDEKRVALVEHDLPIINYKLFFHEIEE